MQKLSRATKLKLIIPFLYLALSILLFIVTWPDNTEIRHIAGVLATIVAFILWLTARVQLGNAFSLAPKSSFIVTTGLYSRLRHPVYYFSILAVIGLSVYIWEWPMIIIVFALIALEVFRIKKEEVLLTSQFGGKYLDYKNTTWF
jgi:protein-S-isoprenylcysteine O-methyltransferase Ste14